MTTANEVLDAFETFSYEREQIAQAAIEAKLAYQTNQLPLETASELLKRLHSSLKSEE